MFTYHFTHTSKSGVIALDQSTTILIAVRVCNDNCVCNNNILAVPSSRHGAAHCIEDILRLAGDALSTARLAFKQIANGLNFTSLQSTGVKSLDAGLCICEGG